MSVLYLLIFAFILAIAISVPVFGGFGKKSTKTKRKNAVSIDRAHVLAKWNEIEQTVELGGPAHLKASVMDADKLVEYVLTARAYNGNTFAEKLKSAKPSFRDYTDYDNLWYAHKVRNSIAHDNGQDFSLTNAKKAIEYFKKALKVLGAM